MTTDAIRTITIVILDDCYFSIHEGEHLTTQLCWDEFLGSIAVITHPQLGQQKTTIPPYARMIHIDEHIARYVRHRLREIERERSKESVSPGE